LLFRVHDLPQDTDKSAAPAELFLRRFIERPVERIDDRRQPGTRNG
jgi:hypothetical protein